MAAAPTGNDTLVCRIESLAHGRFGIARTPDGVVMVPGVAPGDELRVRITASHRRYREAEPVEWLRAGPARREAPCAHHPECGGCPWQQVGREAQLAAKEVNLREQLRRIGGFDPAHLELRPILASPEWRYRHRLTLRVDAKRRLGLSRAGSHELVEIADCHIAEPAVNAGLALARSWLAGVAERVDRVQIAADEEGRLAFAARVTGTPDDAHHRAFLAAHPALRGIALHSGRRRWSFGEPLSVAVDEEDSVTTRGSFTQVSRWGNRVLAACVLELAAPRPGERVLDLYCGTGNLGLPLARRGCRVLGVDSDPAAVADGAGGATSQGLDSLRFRCESASRFVRRAVRRGERYPLVLLDPPRAGARGLIEPLARLGAERIVYVSCHPAALARDLRGLADAGYRVGPIQPVDLFPQTFHLETVVRLEA